MHELKHPQGSGVADIAHLKAEFCVDTMNEAIRKFGPPDTMNADQGSQFTSFAWIDRLHLSNVRISINGKGRFLDNVFVE